MKRIVIFSDSLALPRSEPEVTNVEDTYPYLLRSEYEVFQCSIGGGLISELLVQTSYYTQYKPDIVIIQSGIVDCAPRAFSRLAYRYLDETRIGRVIKRVVKATITTRRIRNKRKISWTLSHEYRNTLSKFQDIFHDSQVFALSIVPVSDTYEAEVPGIRNKVDSYNKIIKDVYLSHYIDLSDIPSAGVMSDGHHLTNKGHQFVYEKIKEKIDDVQTA